jgi:lipopolysaccharide/colanic/teichoic acid biosynthesis glycosyltransferase/nucleoside-diphosphate-sugar epimerase
MESRLKILVTGCTGYIAQELIKTLGKIKDYSVVGTYRKPLTKAKFEVVTVGEINATTNWKPCLLNIDVVVHAAGRAHIMHETSDCSLDEFRRINVVGTLNLARQAVAAGIRRFIYISSIGVNGFKTMPGRPFVESDQPNPHDAYTLSKWEAEQGLFDISIETGLEVVIIRPPLVYGTNAPGNFHSLLRILQLNWPLPFGSLENKRSLISLSNLIDFILTCIRHPSAANQIFFVSDGHDLSTPELIKYASSALGVKTKLIRLPKFMIKLCFKIIGKNKAAQRLCDSLQVDISKASIIVGWTPPLSVEAGFKEIAFGVQAADKWQFGFPDKIKRFFDLVASVVALVILFPLIILLTLLIKLTNKGPALYWSERVGRRNIIFMMPKFRTMQVGTPALPTHLLSDSGQYLTPVGSFLRTSSLDELPQLWSILVGDMSFVGPRPALFNQDDLIALRKEYGVDKLVPGLTGWAQVNGRDELSIKVKVQFDLEYLQKQSFWFDMKILGLTFLKVIRRSGISH